MKTLKIIQLVIAGALPFGLNMAAEAATPINLGHLVKYTNSTHSTELFQDYYSFTLPSSKTLTDVIFNYFDTGLLSQSTLSIYSDTGKKGPSKNDKLVVDSTAYINGSTSYSEDLTAGKYYVLVDAYLPKKTATEHTIRLGRNRIFQYYTYTPSKGSFEFTKFTQTSLVPEPNVVVLMLAGIGLVGFMSYRRQQYLN